MNVHVDAREHPLREEWEALRGEVLQWIAGAAILAAFALACVGLADPNVGSPRIWAVVIILTGLPGASLWLLKHTYAGASATLLIGLMVSVVMAVAVYSAPRVIFALPLIVFVTPLLIGHFRTHVAAAAMIVFAWALEAAGLLPISGSDVVAVLLLVIGSLGLSWVAYRPMRTTLDWAWVTYLDEQREMLQARERQAELAAVSKALAEACERLEEVNLALAQARRAADDARHLKDQFVTAISHELRTPLNLIIGFSEMIAHGSGPEDGDTIPDSLHRDIETIYRNACHLSGLVDDVLDLGRLDAQRLALQKEWSSLPEIAQQAIAATEGLYERAGLTISIDVSADLPRLYVDPTRIRQVLINLLTNAVRYMEEGGTRITAHRDGGDVIVSVEDTGAGIPPEDLPFVFEPFRQMGHAQRRGGFGLGLTVSKQFVEMHAGAMWVVSRTGQGAAFRFSLPVTDNVAAVAAEPRLRALKGQRTGASANRRILVLGDDAEAARILQRYLDDYQIVRAAPSDGMGRAGKPGMIDAVIICDNDAVDRQGLSDRASALHPHTPVLRCALRTIHRASRELGVAGFLTKPVSRDALRDTIYQLRPRPRRVLIVDDDPEMLRLLSQMLRSLLPHCRIVTAASGQQGLDLARTGFGNARPDLVLLDLLMPGLDGHAFLGALRADAALCHARVVIVSAASEEDHDVVTGDLVEIRRSGGLSVAEVMRVIRGSLASLA